MAKQTEVIIVVFLFRNNVNLAMWYNPNHITNEFFVKTMKPATIRTFAWIYAIMFFAIVALNYIPSIHDADGNMFGLFKLDPIDDFVHLATAIWAFIAAWASFKQSSIFFKVFGTFYFIDGILCMIFGQCLADLTLFTNGHNIAILNSINFMDRLALNIPHIVIGGAAILIGFWLSKKASSYSA